MAHNTRSKSNYNNNPPEENNSNVPSNSNTKRRRTNFSSQNFRKSRLSGLPLTNPAMTSHITQWSTTQISNNNNNNSNTPHDSNVNRNTN